MTPARLAEIRAYINRLDLDQLPPWTVEQAIIRDLWETLEAIRDDVDYAYDKWVHGAPAAMHEFASRLLDNEHRADAS